MLIQPFIALPFSPSPKKQIQSVPKKDTVSLNGVCNKKTYLCRVISEAM